MASITLKNIPDDLYERLKQAAVQHRRSITQEILYRIERTMEPRPIDVAATLERARQLRERAALYITEEEINEAKNEGRP